MSRLIKTAAVIIQNESGQIVLAKRSSAANHHAGYWENCGGHLEDGESFEEAAIREAKEELGIEIDSLEKVIDKTFADDERPNNYRAVVFKAMTHQEPKLLEPEVFDQIKWFRIEQLPEIDLASYTKDDFRELGWID